jgi:hypothetical protein
MIEAYMAETALTVQDACNASGVVYALDRFVMELDAERRQGDQDWLADHPVVILFADKLDDLCRCREMDSKPTATTLINLMAMFKTTMDGLCEQSHRESRGTDWRNQHPDCQDLVLQLVHLVGSRSTSRFSDAYDACQQMTAVTPTT